MATTDNTITVPQAPPKPIRAPVIPTKMEPDRKKKHPRQDKHKKLPIAE